MRAMLHDFALMHYTYLRSILDSREPVCDNQESVRSFVRRSRACCTASSRCRGSRSRLIEMSIGGFCLYPPRAPDYRRRMGGEV